MNHYHPTSAVEVWEFDSAAEFAAAWQGTEIKRLRYEGDSWYGRHSTTGSALHAAQFGDDAYVAEAQAILDQVNAGDLQAPHSEWHLDVAGAFPIVPEFLAGNPENMLAMHSASSTRAPVSVFIDLTSSGGISADALARRGVTLLALAVLLTAERPVTLRAGIMLDHHSRRGVGAVVVHIPTSPLELATACNVLTCQAFTRGLGYTWIQHKCGSSGAWAWNNADYQTTSRRLFNLGPDDVYVPPMHIHHSNWQDPVAWITAELDKFRERDG